MQIEFNDIIHGHLTPQRENGMPYYNLLSSSHISLGDESEVITKVYEEWNRQEDEDERYDELVNTLPMPLEYSCSYSDGLLYNYRTPANDTITIQITDHHILYIETKSGQY